VTAKNNAFFDNKRWLLETPKVIRQQASFEAAKNFKAAWSNKRNGNISHFRMGFKSKRDRSYVLGVEKQLSFVKQDAKNSYLLTVLPETIGSIRFFEKPPINNKPDAECSVMRDAFGDFWLLVPVKKAIKRTPNSAVLAIDPGVRTPFSCYSPDGRASLEGLEMKQRIEEVQQRVAATDRRVAAATSRSERRKLLLHRLRLFRQYQRVRDDCHWKTIHNMTEEYGTILLPHLETSRLCGGLRAKSNRQMFGVSHFLFKQRMVAKCEEKSVVFVDANESYTSKTCGRCGHLDHDLGDKERFGCPACGLRCHRDLHAARNIYMRWACGRKQEWS
jgi:transposase